MLFLNKNTRNVSVQLSKTKIQISSRDLKRSFYKKHTIIVRMMSPRAKMMMMRVIMNIVVIWKGCNSIKPLKTIRMKDLPKKGQSEGQKLTKMMIWGNGKKCKKHQWKIKRKRKISKGTPTYSI